MPVKAISKVYFYALLMGFAALWISPFAVSLSTGIIALTVLISFKQIWTDYRSHVILVALFIILGSIDFLRGGDTQKVSAKLMLLAGFAFLHLGALLHLKRKSDIVNLLLIASSIVAVINIHSVVNYLINKEVYDQMLLQSKAISIFNMHHIHFGVINALSIFSLIGCLVYALIEKPIMKKVAWGLLVILTVCFHILSSRTGLIAFYSSIVFTVFVFAISRREFKKLLLVIGGLCLLLISSYYLVQPFQNKVYNSLEDIESWRDGGDINFKSMGMRFEAYRMCNAIIADHSWIGVGAGHQERSMQEMYVKKNTVLEPINRIGPHNQFLEFGVKYGILGIILIGAYFLVFVRDANVSSYMFLGVLCVLFVSMQFESLLERQTSIYFVTLFTGVGYNLFRKSDY